MPKEIFETCPVCGNDTLLIGADMCPRCGTKNPCPHPLESLMNTMLYGCAILGGLLGGAIEYLIAPKGAIPFDGVILGVTIGLGVWVIGTRLLFVLKN